MLPLGSFIILCILLISFTHMPLVKPQDLFQDLDLPLPNIFNKEILDGSAPYETLFRSKSFMRQRKSGLNKVS